MRPGVLVLLKGHHLSLSQSSSMTLTVSTYECQHFACVALLHGLEFLNGSQVMFSASVPCMTSCTPPGSCLILSLEERHRATWARIRHRILGPTPFIENFIYFKIIHLSCEVGSFLIIYTKYLTKIVSQKNIMMEIPLPMPRKINAEQNMKKS